MWRTLTDSIMLISRETFGEPIVYQGTAGPPITINGIFEEASDYQRLDGSAEIEGTVAFVDFRTDDLTFKPKRNDMIIVSRISKPFKMLRVEYDGFSRHRCYLREFVP